MDETAFSDFLKRGGRSPGAVARCVRCAQDYEEFLRTQRAGRCLTESGPEDLETFVASIESEPKASAKTHLWSLCYYYEHTSNEDMRQLAAVLREQRITRRPFALKDFRGAKCEHVERLASAGIHNVAQMLEAGSTPKARQSLADRTSVPIDAVLELVKLSDLARIPGVKGIRARFYYDAGIETPEELARWDPEELRATMVEFVERTGFEGIAPLPAEARFTVAQAGKLPKVVEYSEYD